MASLNSPISWTDSTWNPTTGCTKVSDGCLHCYAETLTNRLFGGDFGTVKMHPSRIPQVSKFGPIRKGGVLVPRMVFVNSMSDLMHADIPDGFRDQVFSAMEGHPNTIFQVLTKRPMTLRRYITDRYKNGPIPLNLWLGVSVEDNRVAGRIDILRSIKNVAGPCTTFLSIEPLIGPVDKHDYTGIDWVLVGGESGPQARDCSSAWVRHSLDLGRAAGAALWFKQWGKWQNNPLYRATPDRWNHTARIRWATQEGERLATEKGGATLDGKTYRELPPAFHMLAAPLNCAPGLV